MISQPLFVVIMLGFLCMLLVWASARRLVRDASPIVVAFPQRTLRELMQKLVAAPLVLAAVHLAVLFALARDGDFYSRMAQGLFFLGWWAAITIMVFSQVVAVRVGSPVPGSSVVGVVLAVGVLALFSSTSRFVETFSVDGYDRAIIVGLALILMGYTVLRRLWGGRARK